MFLQPNYKLGYKNVFVSVGVSLQRCLVKKLRIDTYSHCFLRITGLFFETQLAAVIEKPLNSKIVNT